MCGADNGGRLRGSNTQCIRNNSNSAVRTSSAVIRVSVHWGDTNAQPPAEVPRNSNRRTHREASAPLPELLFTRLDDCPDAKAGVLMPESAPALRF